MSLTDLVEDASAIEAMVGIAPAEPAVAEPSEAGGPNSIDKNHRAQQRH